MYLSENFFRQGYTPWLGSSRAVAKEEWLQSLVSHSVVGPGQPQDQPGTKYVYSISPNQVTHRVIVEDKRGDAKYCVHLYELNQPHSPVEVVVKRLHAKRCQLVVSGSICWPLDHLKTGVREFLGRLMVGEGRGRGLGGKLNFLSGKTKMPTFTQAMDPLTRVPVSTTAIWPWCHDHKSDVHCDQGIKPKRVMDVWDVEYDSSNMQCILNIGKSTHKLR